MVFGPPLVSHNMNQSQTGASPPSGMKLGDILYIVFRHKWKIIGIALASIAAAGCLWLKRPVSFQSEARLYIRYVVEAQAPDHASANDPQIRSVEQRGDSIINTELQILTSWDLAQQVAEAIGPDRILGKANLPDANIKAINAIRKGLKTEVAKDSSVIQLTFYHRDPLVAQSTLKSLIASYFKKHAEFHAVGAFDDFLVQETDQRRARVLKLETELGEAKDKLGIISLQDTKQAYSSQISGLQQRLLEAEAELAQERAALDEMKKTVPSANIITHVSGTTNLAQTVPAEKVEEYRKVCNRIEALNRREQELLLTFTATSSFVKDVQEQLTKSENLKKQLEEANPRLLAVTIPSANPVPGAAPAVDPRIVLNSQEAHVSGLESRIKLMKEQADKLWAQAKMLNDSGATVSDLERRLLIEQTNYTRFAENLDRSQMDARMGAGKVSNISVIQEPSPALRAPSKAVRTVAMVGLGGIGAGFGLAFLLELFLDPSVKRPDDIESKLRLPLFMSIPLMAPNGKPGRMNGKALPLLSNAEPATSDAQEPHAQPDSQVPTIVHWEPDPHIRPFSDALCNRLITYFEVRQMTHKPKLVAVTSCDQGAGVSTVAVGLAASLSETGEGNVLLVDMNQQNGATAFFHRGELRCGLDDALEAGKRDQAMVQAKLYMVAESVNDGKLPAALPSRFKNLVPRLKASDYDYIIFDMPRVSQVSITPRLSRFMDMVLMVVECEQTALDVVKKASALLSQANPDFGIVLNKSRSYVPRALAQEL
jgi:succinoglycan biosynthesis transport protein ExoP